MSPLKKGENKENMYKEIETSDSEELTTDGDDGEMSVSSEQSEDPPLSVTTRSRSVEDKVEEVGTSTGKPLDIGEHYMVRRTDGKWCKYLIKPRHFTFIDILLLPCYM